MKFAVRWTIGRCWEDGRHSLRHSIWNWHKHFGHSCHYMVCYNGEPPSNLPHWVMLRRQQDYLSNLPLSPTGPAWKLYPPRLFPDIHELILDNDIVLKSIPSPIFDWLSRDDLLLCSEAYQRNYGQFDNRVPPGVLINSGILGFPPGFDFQAELLASIQESGIGKWETHFCEQGCVSSIFCRHKFTQVLEEDVAVGVPEEEFKPGKCGIHFVGLNGGYSTWWSQYLCGKML